MWLHSKLAQYHGKCEIIITSYHAVGFHCRCISAHQPKPPTFLISASYFVFHCIFFLCARLCPSAAVISAHPIHSLDNHHHHYHMGSLASPTRSYLYHQGGGHARPHTCATPISHLDRVDSSGRETPAGQPENGHSSLHSFAHSFIREPAHLFFLYSFNASFSLQHNPTFITCGVLKNKLIIYNIICFVSLISALVL